MYIIDNIGQRQEITDLPAAIEQAREMSGYEYDEPGHEAFNKQRRAYWQDILEKLEALAKEQHSTNQ